MRINYEGCAICDSTWGNCFEEADGERRFFCCALCARQFRSLLARLHAATGGVPLEELVIAGDRRGRSCTVRSTAGEARFEFAFNAEGDIREFRAAPSPA